jgi:phosphatidylserine/phosphatidylglycerophosphate/cardiolipin synthase-like enzyme
LAFDSKAEWTMVWNARFLVKLTVALLALPAAAGESESPGWAAAAERHVARSGFLAGHLLRSHSHALLLRPVTSLANLGYYTLSLTGGAARDVALDVLPRTRSAPPRAVRPEGAEARMDLAAWEERLDRLTGRRATSGSVRLLIDGDAFYARLESEIRRARSSIRFRTYIFDNDDVALEVAELLKARSRAVTVQVLLDGLGTWGGALAESESLPPGHRGPASMPAYLRRDSSIDVRVLANTWLMGDHTKTFIFDDRLAFLGGMNIGREYRHDWHDLMLELEGAVVGDLARDARRALAESRWGVFPIRGPRGPRRQPAQRYH